MGCAWKFSLLLLAATLLQEGRARAAEGSSPRTTREAAATLVVFNTSAPDSRALADYYAERRGIPAEQVIGLDCPTDEEISREEYVKTIATPLRELFERKEWWQLRTGSDGRPEVRDNRIRFVVLMRGMPLKIRTTIQPAAPDQPPPPRPHGGDRIKGYDEASVDSELAVMGAFQEDNFGVLPNPYFRRFTPIMDSSMTAGLLLVCRLDAPTPETVRRMIDDGLHAESEGLFGWAYIDRRSIPESGYREGDEWLQNAATECWNRGMPVILDNMPDILPSGFPVTDAALYYGWYSWVASGAMKAPAPQFRRGAVAVHIHSFSAATLRSPDANWAAPLLVAGAAATLGNVYEPYLSLTPHLDIFNERLLQGFTLAESAYMGLRVLSWMTVIVGDPLYRPFATAQTGGWRREISDEEKPWLVLEDTLRKSARGGLTQVLQMERLARTHPTGLNYEALGMLQSFYGEARPAIESLESAGQLYRDPAQSFRTVIERIRIYQSIGDTQGALRLIDRTAQRPQPPDRARLLTQLRNEVAPPPPTPSPSPARP